MNFLYAFLIVLLIYPVIGTLLFALVESLKTSLITKILVISFGQAFLTGIVIWLICSAFNKDIAEKGVLFVAGTLLRLPFSDRKYLSAVIKESGFVKIEYFSELLIRKTISLTTSEITGLIQSTTRRFDDKPTVLTVSLSGETLKFRILDKGTKIML